MELAEVEELARRVPQLALDRELRISLLKGGITNQNYMIYAGGNTFVLRVSGANTELLGIDRRREAHNHCIAASAGIAPEAIGLIVPEGYLVTEFIAGNKIPPERLRSVDGIRDVCCSLHAIHEGQAFLGTFSPFRTVESYLAVTGRRDSQFSADITLAQKLSEEIEEAMYGNCPQQPRPIHSDLLNDNLIAEGRTIRILDWEYSGMGDVLFDLANLADHHEFQEQDERALLLEYFGEVDDNDAARLRLMRIMSNIREATWGLVQRSISTLDFDFAGYAKEYFGRMSLLASDVRYKDWLQTAVNAD